jgi:hypothetical protein
VVIFTPGPLCRQEKSAISIELEAGRTPGLVWTFWRKLSCPRLKSDRWPSSPSNIPTELYRMPDNLRTVQDYTAFNEWLSSEERNGKDTVQFMTLSRHLPGKPTDTSGTLSQRFTDFPKIGEPPQNSSRQETVKVSILGTNKQETPQYDSCPGDLAPRFVHPCISRCPDPYLKPGTPECVT